MLMDSLVSDIATVFAAYPQLTWLGTLLLGLMVGSFLNVVIHRLPIMMERDWQQNPITWWLHARAVRNAGIKSAHGKISPSSVTSFCVDAAPAAKRVSHCNIRWLNCLLRPYQYG
jgi:prepilin signal peptidase PulO-like enzyme (type II secretory pathway)